MKKLLFDKNFFPIFKTQFLGALNDNLFKQAIIILITFKSIRLFGLDPKLTITIGSGLFILPFFLFSAYAGLICDKHPKNKVIQLTKIAEIFIMLVGALGFVTENILLLLIALFAMGAQSAFFGPAKFSVIPELIKKEDIVSGNAYFESGTFLAILIGTVLGGLIIAIPTHGKMVAAFTIVILACAGYFTSKKIKNLKGKNPELDFEAELFRPIVRVIKGLKKNPRLFSASVSISVFWFLGIAILTIFPAYTKEYLHAKEGTATFLMTLFSIGIGIGSFFSEKNSHGRYRPQLVKIGVIGMACSLILLSLAPVFEGNSSSFQEMLTKPTFYFISFACLLIAFFGGLYTIPLMSLIQIEADEKERSQNIAGLNILNSLAMVLGTVTLLIVFSLKLSFPLIFIILSCCSLLSLISYPRETQ